MKDLRFFETESEYINEKESLYIPTVSLTDDNGKLWIKQYESYITATYYISEENVNVPILLFGNDSVLYDASYYMVDGKKVKNLTEYTFSTIGEHIIEIHFTKNNKCYTLNSAFYGISELVNVDFNNFDISNVTDMSWMFYECYNLTSLDLSSFDTRNVTDMMCMFYGCTGLTSLDLSSFDTKNVTNMTSMFGFCSNLTSITFGNNFDTSNVLSMKKMFYWCSNLTSLDLSSFNTFNLLNASEMFAFCINLFELNLTNWVIDNLENGFCMFYNVGSKTDKALDEIVIGIDINDERISCNPV